ncbi:IS701 family transposase [Acidithiobacillus thiooxidans]|uniref:Transposase IS4-like domain-containing protein n=5 Tax=Acidithiobacillaceae TaxID=225058 RepID=A0A5P9XS80_ACITH|nr:transposase [Acidithiobacillus thiooxidans]QFX96469.1 hypothetical protein GCD22_02248 [Acidithiobacillus thiooxidans ATCC 19377]
MSFQRLVTLRLSEWITYFLAAVPPRSRRSFLELLCGCLISPDGWVTRALSHILLRCHWSTYYKPLERESLRTQVLAIAQVRWLLSALPPLPIVELIIDDTLVLRHSNKAPGATIHFDHSHKHNRPRYVLAQNWVGLALTLRSRSGKALSFPIRLRLVPRTGNTHKLKIAGALLRAFIPHIPVPVRLLTDAWFMRRRLLLPLLRQRGQFIGQVRQDTALYRQPPPKPAKAQRGRPRKYGDKLTPETLTSLPTEILTLFVYGKWQKVRLQSIVVQARFLNGHPVRAVWSALYDAKHHRWSPTRLYLASETDLTAPEVVTLYGNRWQIEPLFHNLKRWWGINNLWQQRRAVLERWMQIRCIAWSMVQLLAETVTEDFPMTAIAPWRIATPVTAGLMAQWLHLHFLRVPFWTGYDPKSGKFQCPNPDFWADTDEPPRKKAA